MGMVRYRGHSDSCHSWTLDIRDFTETERAGRRGGGNSGRDRSTTTSRYNTCRPRLALHRRKPAPAPRSFPRQVELYAAITAGLSAQISRSGAQWYDAGNQRRREYSERSGSTATDGQCSSRGGLRTRSYRQLTAGRGYDTKRAISRDSRSAGSRDRTRFPRHFGRPYFRAGSDPDEGGSNWAHGDCSGSRSGRSVASPGCRYAGAAFVKIPIVYDR